MKALPHVYNETLVTQDYRHFFEVGLGFWLSERGNPRPGYQYFLYGNWIGGSIDPTAKSSLSNLLTRVRAVAQGIFLTESHLSILQDSYDNGYLIHFLV